jgi:gas vesicle protein
LINDKDERIAELETEVGYLKKRIELINNICVGFHESGPHEPAEQGGRRGMNPKETYRELRAVQEKYKNKKTETFEIRISDMAKDVADTIEALQQENAELKEKLVQFMSEENEKIIELQQRLAPLQGKAALVLGVPESCMHCRLSMYLKYCGDVCKATLVNGEYAICPKTGHRPKWCPLMVVGGEK